MNKARITSTTVSASVRTRVKVPIHLRSSHQRFEAEMVTFSGLCDTGEHLAIVFEPLSSSPHVRVHSECLTGDVFGSALCDCGEQLDEAITMLGKLGGILLYLRQEGRGIGLYNKLDAYDLQISQGLDTYAANQAINFPEDMRDFRVAAEMLQALGIFEISLVTNNPDKISQLERSGISVKHVLQTGVFVNSTNHRYLRTKIDKHHHTINLGEELQ
ncbi:GTP cyclohydrolase II [Xenorhabdus hominickii]|uniref:GTP cyclohydrolase II n=1 Tax=Xenorhabdus hominickii TaxID=351679 RepID=A0A2G0Q4D9_XENHO|nr:GTP cyclohydrolase II [Xenorhabdus hominickii]AOM42966.1 GTP cyclohydrolase [Xenorhabdus hominickii]PHM54083.1 riboflavin biosynthesis protein ribA/GTP-cyclohydrolase II [Xenorhabdus hominickii]